MKRNIPLALPYATKVAYASARGISVEERRVATKHGGGNVPVGKCGRSAEQDISYFTERG